MRTLILHPYNGAYGTRMAAVPSGRLVILLLYGSSHHNKSQSALGRTASPALQESPSPKVSTAAGLLLDPSPLLITSNVALVKTQSKATRGRSETPPLLHLELPRCWEVPPRTCSPHHGPSALTPSQQQLPALQGTYRLPYSQREAQNS